MDEQLLQRNEYLASENQILRSQIKGRIRLNDADRIRLAEIGKRLGRKALAEVARIVRPETIMAWHRRLVARKFDGTKHRKAMGRPPTPAALTALVLRVAEENRTWGYDRNVGALENLGHRLSRQTVASILKRNGVEPAPERGRRTTWKYFIRSNLSVLAATDFFTAEVWPSRGLITYYVLFVMRVAQRRIQVLGITSAPDGLWMEQIARRLTLADVGFLSGCRYLLHDRDAKFTVAFDAILESAGVGPLILTSHSPNLNAYAERCVRSAKEECSRS